MGRDESWLVVVFFGGVIADEKIGEKKNLVKSWQVTAGSIEKAENRRSKTETKTKIKLLKKNILK